MGIDLGGRTLATHTGRSLRLLAASIVLVGGGMLATSVGVLAQSGSGATGSVVSGCSTTASGGTCGFTFNFQNQGGFPACETTATFTVTGISTASMNPTSAAVDCTTGNVQSLFSAGSGCGTATITATDSSTLGVAGATVQSTVTVPCTAVAPLPNTSTLPPTPSPWWGVLAGLAALVVLGGGVGLRRMRATV
jgi:hypothetical protein